MSYKHFADYYDRLMTEDINYSRIADYIENLFDRYDINPKLIADLACGTGNVTIPMSERGYEMIGVDNSIQMLEVARKKATEKNLDILFLNQDIAKLDLFGTCDAFLCMIDGVNYILQPKSLCNMFKRIKTCFLNPGGIFVFDISSFYKLSEFVGNNTFIHDGDDIFYAWENKYHPNMQISEMYLNFFVKEKKGYRRFCERHFQKAYKTEEIIKALKKAGFADVDCYDGLAFSKPKKDSKRVIFAAR